MYETRAETGVNDAARNSKNVFCDAGVVVDVSHVSMEFNMASERMDSLKEYAVALARRRLFFESFKAIDDISLQVEKGDVFGIVGTNGSGKSTLLKIIAGVMEPSKGSCSVYGTIAPLIELGAGFDMDLSARENIYLNGALLGYSKKTIDAHFDDIVSFAEIERFLDMPMKNYSSGMVARIAFAIATVLVPDILIVDEVLSVGDFMFQRKCEERIVQLIDRGVTVLIVSHSIDQIARLCNKAIWIESGHVRALGTSEDVCRAYRVLGGRSGSDEATARIFDAVWHIRKKDDAGFRDKAGSDDKRGRRESVEIERFSNQSACALSIELAQAAWADRPVDTVVLVCTLTHSNTVALSGLAGFFDAPLIALSPDRLESCLLYFLDRNKPKRIIIGDVAGRLSGFYGQIEAFPWQPELMVFSEGSHEALSLSVLRHGCEVGAWGKGTAVAIIDFALNQEAFGLSPYLFSQRIPLLVSEGGRFADEGKVRDGLLAAGVRQALLIGKDASHAARVLLEECGIEYVCLESSDVFELVARIAELREPLLHESRELCLSMYSLGHWQDCIALGSYVGSTGALLVQDDLTDLDRLAANLDSISSFAKTIERVSVIGEESLVDADTVQLFVSTIEQA